MNGRVVLAIFQPGSQDEEKGPWNKVGDFSRGLKNTEIET